MIGTGTFGQVYLGILEQKAYAVKILSKKHIIKLNQVKHTKDEKTILESLKHPFIVNLVKSFQDELNLYLIFDFV